MTALAAAAAPHAVTARKSARLPALDVWRGAIVALMAIDHAALFLGLHPMPEGLLVFGQPLRPQFSSTLAWATRFVTHYCAPGFVFLAGASVVLLAASRQRRGWSQAAIAAHLIVRGALLIVLEYTLVAWGWGAATPQTLFQVIGCIGACLILGAGLRYLPRAVLVLIGAAIMLLHPLLTDPHLSTWIDDVPSHWRRVLLVAEPMAPRWPSLYPVLPWLGVFTLGLGFGKAVRDDAGGALRRWAIVGAAMLGAWLAIRLTDGFAAVLASQGSALEHLGTSTPVRPGAGWQDFFAMSKYPPLADYVCWTLGGGLLFVWAVARSGLAASPWAAPLRVFGRVPLFFYVVHLYLYRGLVNALTPAVLPGHSFATAWTIWLLGLLLLLPACLVYGKLKQRWPGFPLDLF